MLQRGETEAAQTLLCHEEAMFEDIQASSSSSESKSSTSESESESEAVPVKDDCHQPQGVLLPIIDSSFIYHIFPEMNQGDSKSGEP